jgi:hypothetical protein
MKWDEYLAAGICWFVDFGPAVAAVGLLLRAHGYNCQPVLQLVLLRLACMIIYDQHYDLHVGPEAVHAQCLCHDIVATPPVAPCRRRMGQQTRKMARAQQELEPITGRILLLCSVSSAP